MKTMSQHKAPHHPSPHPPPPFFHAGYPGPSGPMDADLFCPRFRMADRPDHLYMWESMEGQPQPPSSDVGGPPTHMDPQDCHPDGPLSLHGPMSRPPPMAHGGNQVNHVSHPGPIFSPPHTPTPSSRSGPLGQDGMGGLGSMGGGPLHHGSNHQGGPPHLMSGMPTSVSSHISTTSPPLVIPQPVKGQGLPNNNNPAVSRSIKTYHCRMCDQEFENKSDMQRHSKEVHRLDEKGHKCPKCFKSFPTSQQLAQHSLVHTNIRKYQCQYCDKAFKQLSHVQQHQRIHTGERPYKCHFEGCGKAFVQLSGLQHHLKNPNLHSTTSSPILTNHLSCSDDFAGERPYKCTMESCSKSFAQLANLQGHLKSHDSRAAQAEKKPFCCNVCDRRFATEASLNHHVTKLHSAQLARPMDLTCQVCEKQCADEERFFKHIHKYHPDYWRVFSNGRPLTDFVEIREPKRREKRYSCPICNKKYSHETGYVKHLATHPGSDPKLRLQLYSCPVNSCQKLFTKETYLLRHMEMKLDPPHTGALDEWKKRPPAQQVMMTRPVSIPEDLMTRAATIDGPSSSSSSSSMHERLALMRSLASTPHRGNQSPPQNLGRERPSSPHVILDDGHQPMEICESHSSTQQLPHPHHPHHPHHSTKLEIIHATATPVCSTETFKFTQPPSHHLAGKSPHRHSTPSDLGAEVPCDLTTGVTSTCLSPGPMSSGSSTPPTPAFPRAGEMNLGQNTVFQRLHDMQTVASLGTYPNRNVSSRSFSMNDLHLEANYGKSSLVQNSYTVPKIPASPNLPHHNSMTGQNLSCSSNNTFPRSPEPQLPKSPEVSLLRSDNASHYSPDGANTPGLSPSRHGLTLDNHSGFVTSHSSFIESHHEAVPSSPAAVASPAPLHGMIPPTASFLHPSVTTSFSGHSGLQSMSHHYIHRAPNPEHEVASTLQNLARSLSNFR